jgi:hypothetical protein
MSQLYPKAREKFLTAQLDWSSGTWRAMFLQDTYTPDFTYEFLNEIPATFRVAISQPIASRTATNGFAYGEPAYFPLLFDTRLISQAVIFHDTGVENTSELVYHMDSEQLINTPFQPVGFDYYIYPNLSGGGFWRL